MKNASLSIALRIGQIIHESSDRELDGALKILREHGFDHELLSCIVASKAAGRAKKRVVASRSDLRREAIRERMDRLRELNPSSHSSLLRFEQALQDGSILPGAEEIRQFGMAISKRFKPGKRRADSVASLIFEMAAQRPEDIQAAIGLAERNGTASGANDFSRLAHYLIGRKSK